MNTDAVSPPKTSVWTVRLDSRRRPTLPEEVLVAAGLEPGAELRVHVAEKGCLVIETPEHVLKRAKSRIKTKGSGSEVDAFLAERAAEALQE
jgi:bifunctional DNA-binding transcriptional regulator/antitoxin component of YhaV-PrlF toxin-antitoxin module